MLKEKYHADVNILTMKCAWSNIKTNNKTLRMMDNMKENILF